MPPRSTVGVVAPNPENIFHHNADEWLEDKRKTDGAEGLWRINDGLYDVSAFIGSHPGGKFWLEDSKGTDITEAFEVHHISTYPETLLQKYYVRQAEGPRSSPFTFHDDGFYRTVKRRVREALKTVPESDRKWIRLYSDLLVFGTFLFAILAAYFWNYYFLIPTAVCFGFTTIAAHNYTHQKDNWRMYYADLMAHESRNERIVHVLSHHMLTNTIADLQLLTVYPVVNYFPEMKSAWIKYGNVIYQPLLLWPSVVPVALLAQTYRMIVGKNKITFNKFLPFALPIAMYIFGGQSIFWTLAMWIAALFAGSWFWCFVTFTGTHFHPHVFVDGDTPRADCERDWGINQLDSVSDRYEPTGNLLLVLITFGDHALHHLFPTLDHGVLHHLYPIVEKTAEEFDLNIRFTTTLDMFTGYFRRIAQDTPNPNLPDLAVNLKSE